MKTRIIVQAGAQFAVITTTRVTVSVLLDPTLSPAESLRLSAREYRDRADRLDRSAGILDEAAKLYEVTE